MRWLLALFCLVFHHGIPASAVETLNGKVIEKVLVLKSAHQLQLIKTASRSRPIAFPWANPRGQIDGGRQTHAGGLLLDRLAQDQRHFNLAMHISYPNISDSARARREGVAPGGMIMIHGTPIPKIPRKTCSTPWTGPTAAWPCATGDMREVWNLVPDGTMIEIRP
jgi:murein L,D-transpeptidase YafK